MEWKRGALVAMVGLLLIAAFAESTAVDAAVDEVIQLVSDGGNDFPRKMMKGAEECPRQLVRCKKDSDCHRACKCMPYHFCGKKERERMEWKRAGLAAMVGMLLMAAFTESGDVEVEVDEMIELVSDRGVNDLDEASSKMP
ncbi:hypothetical protein SDJN03_24488, partial [Cucurbita argyrosperma subsp. sororia]